MVFLRYIIGKNNLIKTKFAMSVAGMHVENLIINTI